MATPVHTKLSRRRHNRQPANQASAPSFNPDDYKLVVMNPKFDGPDNSVSSIQHPRGERATGSDGTWIRGEVVGTGNFGTVYLERNIATDKARAVKQLIASGTVFRERELKGMLFGNTYPRLFVNFHGWFRCGGNMYIAMEYLPAGNLKEYMSRNGVFDEEVAKNVTEQILQGVHVLHENRIMHRDIKPENILVVPTASSVTIRLVDFGLAKAFGGSIQTRAGTEYWAAPEQRDQYDQDYDEKVDMWSVGCVIYYLFTYRNPFCPREEDALPVNITDRTFPFWPRITRRQFDTITRPGFQTVVRGISCTANGFIKNLIALNPNTRMTALQALQHEWICPTGTTPLESALKHGDLALARLLSKDDCRYTPHAWDDPLTPDQCQIVLRVAAANGQHDLVKATLQTMPRDYYFEPSVPGWSTVPSLVGAAAFGNLRTVNLLLKKLPHAEKRNGIHLQAFQAALRGKRAAVVDCLKTRFDVGEYVWIDRLKLEIASFGNTDQLLAAILTLMRYTTRGVVIGSSGGAPAYEAHFAAMLSDAAEHDCVDNVTLLWDSRPSDDLAVLDEALLRAVRAGHTAIVDVLLKYYPFLAIDAQNQFFSEVLVEASRYGQLGIVKSLLSWGVFPDARAIKAAVLSNSTAVFQYLIRDLRITYRQSPSQILRQVPSEAIPHSHKELLYWLWGDSGARYSLDLVSHLRNAAHLGNLDAVQWLLEGIMHMHAEALGDALVGAAEGGHVEIVMFLIEKGVNTNIIGVWKAAAAGGHVEVLEILLARNPTPTRRFLESSLNAAVGCGHFGTTLQLLCAGAPVNENLGDDAALLLDPVIVSLVRNFTPRG